MEENSTNGFDLPPLERRRKKRLTPAGIALVVIFFLLCAGLGFWVGRMLSDPLVPPPKTPVGGAAASPAYTSSSILNILILGVDQRENEPARADTIILASFNLEDKEIFLLSIPRDTRVEIAEKNIFRKINYAHAVGGAELTVKTVEKFLEVPVHYYIETNFDGFAKCIDILGGVTLNVEERMYLPLENIDLQAGLQKLDGEGALSYVRWRGDGRGDIGRIERQQKFFKVLYDQVVSFSTIWRIPEIIGELNKNVKTDLSLQKMVSLANRFRDLDNLKLEARMVPGVPDDVNYGGSYWIADQKELDTLVTKIYTADKDAGDREDDSK